MSELPCSSGNPALKLQMQYHTQKVELNIAPYRDHHHHLDREIVRLNHLLKICNIKTLINNNKN